MKIKNDLITTKYTEIHCENKDEQKYNAPHHFSVREVETGDILTLVDFQEGPIKEVGVNGVHNEDLIAMVLTRLYSFQESKFACTENEIAIKKLEQALMWLRRRTEGRIIRNVEGTSNV